MCRIFDVAEHADVIVEMFRSREGLPCTFASFCAQFAGVQTVLRSARLKQWHRCFGLGVAGNVAGHMEQAGEADPAAAAAPKPKGCAGIFTFYAPHPHSVDASEDEVIERLERLPVTNAVIRYPAAGGHVQVEPELGLYVDIVYTPDGSAVERLVPRRVAAFNDCSIRELTGATKLDQKKNWGEGSKGLSLRSFRIDSLAPGTLVDRLVIVSYVRRAGKTEQYSVAAPARTYLCFHEELLEYIVDRINHQASEGKFEPIWPELVRSDYPTSMWCALGAGEYTEWGKANFLQRADQALVMVYDEQYHPSGPTGQMVEKLLDDWPAPDGLIALHQTFV